MAINKTIVWDVDDVLNELTRQWFRRSFLPAHPGCALSYDDLRANPPHELLGVSLAEYLASLDDFRRGNYDDLAPRPEVLDAFQRLGEGHHHLALTAAPLATAHRSARWVMRHFGRWIRGFHFIPSARAGCNAPAYDRTKGEALARLVPGGLLVDDSPQNVDGAQARGVDAVLFPAPWNELRRVSLAEHLNSILSEE